MDEDGPFYFFRCSDGHRVHYRSIGSPRAPKKIVFIMGLMANARGWYRQIEYFSQRQDEFQCVFLDNRGIRFSDAGLPGPFSTYQMALDVVEVIHNGLQWDKYAVVGTSMGGMIAQHVALIAGDSRIFALLLIATRAQSTWWSRLPSASTWPNFFWRALSDPRDTKTQAQLTADLIFSSEFLSKGNNRKIEVERLKKSMDVQTPHRGTFINQFAAVRNHELTDEECDQIKNANYFVGAYTGDCDRLVPHMNTLAMKRLLGAEIRVVAGVDHGCPVESADDVNPWIEEKISQAFTSLLRAKL